MSVDIKHIGHAAFRLSAEGKTIYIDPYNMPPGEPIATAILITHDHYDHCSAADAKKVAGPSTVVLAPEICRAKLRGIGGKFIAVKPGGSYDAGGVSVRTVPAYNLGKTFHSRSAGHVGYIVLLGGESIYHAGDTDLIPEMENLRPDVALLPVGGTYTMTAEEAAEAFKKLGAKRAIPMHFGVVVGSKADADRFFELIGGPSHGGT